MGTGAEQGRDQGQDLALESLHDPCPAGVLVALPDPGWAAEWRGLLSGWGFSVEVETVPARVAPLLDAVDVVVAAVDLPDEGCLELLRATRAATPPPGLIVAAEASAAAALPLVQAGAVGFIDRSCSAEKLFEVVNAAVQSARVRRDLLLHRTLVRTISDVIIGVDQDGAIRYLNAGAVAAAGVPAAEVIGLPIRDLLPDASGVPAGELRELPLLRPRGGEGCLRGQWIPLGDGVHAEVGRLFVGRDVSTARRVRREVARSGALAELGLMVTKAAHDINNPATYVIANLATLREDIVHDDVDQTLALQMLDEALEGMHRITQMVRQLRRAARAQVEDEPVPIALVDVVRAGVGDVDLPDGAPVEVEVQVFTAVRVLGLASRVRQAVANLVRNAVDALAGQAVPAPRVKVTVDTVDGCGVVRVQDNGPGIPTELADRIFEPFVTTKGEGEGTGLGLSISKAFIEQYGGVLRSVGPEGRGACFEMVLPVVEDG